MDWSLVFSSAILCCTAHADITGAPVQRGPSNQALRSIIEKIEGPKRAPAAMRAPVVDQRPYFDIPVTYNSKVKFWINFYQTSGRKWFRTWLERSHAYLPQMQSTLKGQKMPQDLAYVAMIESGFSAHAKSTAEAVGYWQFIGPTANRYGLRTSWWLDERRDFNKSTFAAARYLGDLYQMFDSWYLTAAAYNMGEGKMKRLIAKYGTKNYWLLSRKAEFPDETREYIPKLLAAMMIAKAPALYGFTDIKPQEPYRFELFNVPGGTDLFSLAAYLNVKREVLERLNPELVKGYVPNHVESHRIRIPLGFTASVSRYIRGHL
jgi:membrane-bound lytic murein transglycosylase D